MTSSCRVRAGLAESDYAQPVASHPQRVACLRIESSPESVPGRSSSSVIAPWWLLVKLIRSLSIQCQKLCHHTPCHLPFHVCKLDFQPQTTSLIATCGRNDHREYNPQHGRHNNHLSAGSRPVRCIHSFRLLSWHLLDHTTSNVPNQPVCRASYLQGCLLRGRGLRCAFRCP